MNSLIKAAAVAAALAVPAVSFAQQANRPLTRAEVKADLQRLEAAGYRPEANEAYYPDNIQAAEARVHQTSGYGPGMTGSSQSGGGNESGAASSYSPPVTEGQ